MADNLIEEINKMKKIHEINLLHKETASMTNNNINPMTIEPEIKKEERNEMVLEKNQNEEKNFKKGKLIIKKKISKNDEI